MTAVPTQRDYSLNLLNGNVLGLEAVQHGRLL